MTTILVRHNGAIQPTEVFLPVLDEWVMAIPDPLAVLDTETGDLKPVWLYPEHPELSEEIPASDGIVILTWRSYEDFLNAVGL